MQKLITIDTYNYTTAEANAFLEDGWKVIQMCPFVEPVAICGEYYNNIKGNYGALLLLEKEEEKLKKEED